MTYHNGNAYVFYYFSYINRVIGLCCLLVLFYGKALCDSSLPVKGATEIKSTYLYWYMQIKTLNRFYNQ